MDLSDWQDTKILPIFLILKSCYLYLLMATPFLQTISLSKIYPGATGGGLNKTDLTIQAGLITAIIGASGSGKSTLLSLLYGLQSPDSGEVRFKGEKVWGPEVKLIPGHEAMKMVTQAEDDLNLFAKVGDNVSVLLPNTNLQAKKEKTEKVLRQLNMLHLAEKRVVDLSGGEKQRVAIARALVTQPQVLLLDEPFNQVDTSFRDGLQDDIRQIVKETGLTVVMVSHDPAEVLSMADVLLVLKDGRIIEEGHPKKIYNDPQYLYTAQLLTNCNVLTADEARLCGINATKTHVMLYPEWAEATASWSRKNWEVKRVLFKGFYEELVVENNSVLLRILNGHAGKYIEGNMVNLKIGRYLEY
jgi:ABC-type Fe3+/spermidine/putrescine transport system ATPase subunit